MLMVGWGIQRIQYGEQPHWMAFALASVLGQIGLPGGGIGTTTSIRAAALRLAKGPFLAGVPAKVKPALPFNDNWEGLDHDSGRALRRMLPQSGEDH